jgi:putative protease
LTTATPPVVELLAPAGGPDALVAAVNNGANAVYLGLGELNARRGADNFDLASLAAAARFAHLRGVAVYLTANVVVLPREIQAALAMIDEAWAAGIDAVIVQDLGLLRLVRSELPDVRVHASTQIDAMNAESVRALAALGVSRVTLARELSVDAIAACAATGIEVETFVHGAICYSYSGQCLMSSMIGRRSANRGLCAQPCRLPYELLDPVGESVGTPGRYVLSPRDMAGIAHLPALAGAGVRALKIEGRMKSPEYVAVVTGVYRAALDRALSDPERYEVTPAEWALLEEAFNRGFTDGYLTGERGESLMSYARPNNRGVLLGRITSVAERRAVVQLERSLDPRDTVEVWTRSGRFAQPVGVLQVDGRQVPTASAGQAALIELESAASAGDRVFRVADAALAQAARRTFTGVGAVDHRAVPVSFTVTLQSGQPLTITAQSGDTTAVATGPVVGPARTKAVSADEVIEHVGRLGGSGFRAAGWSIQLESGVGVGFSALHAVRREALSALEEALLAPWSGRSARCAQVPTLPVRVGRIQAPRLVATVWDEPTGKACVEAGADEVYLRVFAGDAPPPTGLRPLLPRVAWPDEVPALSAFADGGPVIVGNLGLLYGAAARGPVSADWPLNVLNAHGAAALAGLGASFAWASPELSGRQLAELVEGSPIPVGCLVWGRVELMVAEQCVLQAAGDCGRRCRGCARRSGWWHLRDLKDYEFPVTTDPSGRSHIMNAVTLDLTRALHEIVAARVAAVRLDFSDESTVRAAEVVRAVRAAVDGVGDGMPAPTAPLVEPATSGHFFRGVL